jgi:hypothetical protein
MLHRHSSVRVTRVFASLVLTCASIADQRGWRGRCCVCASNPRSLCFCQRCCCSACAAIGVHDLLLQRAASSVQHRRHARAILLLECVWQSTSMHHKPRRLCSNVIACLFFCSFVRFAECFAQVFECECVTQQRVATSTVLLGVVCTLCACGCACHHCGDPHLASHASQVKFPLRSRYCGRWWGTNPGYPCGGYP